MDFLNNSTIWDTILRLIKYFSLAATAYFAWYGAAHVTRYENGNLTKAGKIVVRGVLVSLLIGLLSQIAEDKKKRFELDQATIKEDSARKAYELQRSIDDKNRFEQMDRLEAILGKSTVTLNRLTRQDSLQRKMVGNILDVNKQVNYSSNQLGRLMDQQLQLVSQAEAQVYPISPVIITLEYKHPINPIELLPIGKLALFQGEKVELPNRLNYPNDTIQSQIMRNKAEFWSVKFFKKVSDNKWASKAGLVFFVKSSAVNNVLPTLEGLSSKPYLKYKVSISNPERLIFQPDDSSTNLEDLNYLDDFDILDNYFTHQILLSVDGKMRVLDSLIKVDVINVTGPPTIHSAKDLIDCKFVVQTVVTHPGVEIVSTTLTFSNNKSIVLRGKSTNTSLPQTKSLKPANRNLVSTDANRGGLRYTEDSTMNKIVFTGIISPTKIGLFQD